MLVSAVVLKDRPTNSPLKPFSSRWWRDRSWQKEGPGRASAAGCAQKLCDPGTETAVQRRSRGDQGAKRLPERAGEPRGAPQVFACLLFSAGRRTEADESVIKWERMWELYAVQESGIMSVYQNILYGQMWVFIIKILSFLGGFLQEKLWGVNDGAS